MHALSRKDTPFLRNSSCQQEFDDLKQLLVEALVLAYPNISECFLLETDSSGVGLAVVLAQEQDGPSIRPLAYASRSLLKHEQNYGMTELEALAVVWGVKTLPSLLVWSSV